MKPAPFEYHRPATLAEALDLLADLDDARVLAGGQSLVPLMNFRLAVPAHLVDISRLEELRTIDVDDRHVTVGAAVTHAEVEHHAGIGAALAVLVDAERLVAHAVVRNRGTACGSLAHADPASELTAVLALLGGDVELVSAEGQRIVGAADLFLGPMQSCCEPGEILARARFPIPSPGTGAAIRELVRRHGDYAIAGAAASMTIGSDGVVESGRLALFSVGPVPLVLDPGEVVSGHRPDAVDRGAVYDWVAAAVDPPGDIHASADYRRHVAAATAVDAVAAAVGRARPVEVAVR